MDLPASSSVVVVRQVFATSSDELPDWPAEPVTILSRYSDDGFETMHQYDLLPNPKAQDSDAKEKPSNLAYDRLPCVFPSQYTRVMSVAPSSCDLRIGPSGKGFWTETRNVIVRHAKNPARCLVGFEVTTAEGEPKAGGKTGPPTARVELSKDVLYARRCNIHEILWKKYMISATALEDTVGRIAVGDVTGNVEVLDLA